MNLFPTRPSGPSRARTVTDTVSALEDGVRGHIASYLPPSDILAIGPVNNHQTALFAQRTSALRASEASAVYTRAEFMGLLGPEGTQPNDESNSIRGLLPDLRAVPLSALAARISYLPAEDRQATTVELLTAMDEIPTADRTTTFNAQRAAAQMVNTASAVNNRAEFTALLGPTETPVTDAPDSIRSLPTSLRAAPLLELGLLVNSSPQAGARQEMTTEFLAAYNEIPAADASMPLSAMARAAQDSSNSTEPIDSVRRGVNVQYIALFNGITNLAQITQLENEAAASPRPGSAGAAVREGGNVLAVARQHGIFSYAGHRTLEYFAANSDHESSARRSGLDNQQIRQQFGFTDYGIDCLAWPHIAGL